MDRIEGFINWIFEHGSDIVVIFIYAIAFYVVFRIVVWRLTRTIITNQSKKRDKEIVKQRVHTLNEVLIKTGQIIFLVGVLVALLQEANINVAPLLAGLGIVGIAVGFGTQNLIKDLINGIFIIIEGQYSKGDIIVIGDKSGKVEAVNLRKTILRDLDGTVHHIPNSLVGVVSNKSQEWASVNLDITVGCNENLEKVISVLEDTNKKLYKDKEFSSFMLEEPQVLGVDSINEAKITIKILGRTKHLKKWEVTRELRRRIKEAFDKEKIKFV